MSAPQPGWYPDPHSPTDVRYWDGSAWTSQVRPAPESTSLNQLPPPGGQFASPATVGVYPTTGASSSSGGKVLAVVAAAAVLITGGVVAVMAAQGSGEGSPTAAPVAQETPQPLVTPDVDLPAFGDWVMDVPEHWLDVSLSDYLELSDENKDVFVGGWNVDGRSNLKTSSFIFAYQYADVDDSEPLQQVGLYYYGGPFAEMDIATDEDSRFTTTQGIEAWIRTAHGMCGDLACSVTVMLARDSSHEFSITLRDYSESTQYFDEVLAAFNTLQRVDN